MANRIAKAGALKRSRSPQDIYYPRQVVWDDGYVHLDIPMLKFVDQQLGVIHYALEQRVWARNFDESAPADASLRCISHQAVGGSSAAWL